MEFTEKHAELVGLHYGDGSFTFRHDQNTFRFQLRGDAVSDRAHYEEFIIPLCNEVASLPVLGRGVRTVWDRKLNSFGICIQGSKLKDFFAALGIAPGMKGELPVPKWIMENDGFSKAFVRGLFDTDGGIYYGRNNTAKSRLPTKGVIKIVSVSRVLMADVSVILQRLGIKHYFRAGKKYAKNRKVPHFVVIYPPHIHTFMRVIGSHNPKHQSKYNIAQKFGFCPSRTTPIQRGQILKGELNPISLLKRGSDSGQFQQLEVL